MKIVKVVLSLMLLTVNCFAGNNGGCKKITLNECIEAALKSANALKIKSYEVSNFQLEVERAEAIFEPLVWSNVMLNNINIPADSTLDGVNILEITDLSVDIGLTKQLITGTKLDLTFNNFYENTNIVNQVVNPLYKTSVGLNIKQSILSGAKKSTITHTIEVAKINFTIASNDYNEVKNEIENNTKKAYMEFSYSYLGYKLCREILGNIREIEKNAQDKLKAGEISYTDILKIKEKVLEEQAACADMQRQYVEAELILKKLMNIDYYEDDHVKFIPSDIYEPYINKYDFEYVRKKGVSHRYEYIKQLKELDRKEIILKFAEVNNMPALNAVAGARVNGMEKDLFDSYSQMSKMNYYGWQVGLEFSVPVGNKDKRNSYIQAKNELDKEKVKLSDIENNYYYEMKITISRLKFLNEQVENLRQIVAFSNKRFEAVKEKFNKGMASNNDILETLYEMKDIKVKLNETILENNLTAIEIMRLIGE